MIIERMSRHLAFPLDSNIYLGRFNRPNPRILYSRTNRNRLNGYYVIELSDQSDFPPSTALDFAHEYGHVLSNYYQTFDQKHKWFDESQSLPLCLYTF